MVEYRKDFNTWNEFVYYAKTAKTDLSDDTRNSRESKARKDYESSYQEFTGCKSFKEVVDLAENGWTEGLKECKDISSAMFSDVSQMIERVDVNHDVEGHAIDIARFVDGEPEAWLKFENVLQESETGNKLIKISFNCSVSADISKAVITRKGAAIASLVELLEYSGYRVELTIYHSLGPDFFSDTSLKYLVSVKLKTFDQNLDMSIISYALAHPSLLRALMFSVQECAPEDVRRASGCPYGGYGSVADISKEDEGDIVIQGSRSTQEDFKDPKSAEKWIMEQLENQGIHLKKEIKI